jgi:hypothetical protein
MITNTCGLAHIGTYGALLLYVWVVWGGLTRLHPVCF